MAPQHEDDWSDSDSEEGEDVVTAVQLGIPDGALESAADLRDAAVSRIGGYPAFLTAPEPPFESSFCKNCATPMELVIQVWCPMEDSPNDRALYVWACSRGVCQGMAGSVRAWRGLRFNERYAAKLEKKKARAEEKAQAKAAEQQKASQTVVKSNPFSMKAAMPADTFGFGTQIFGDAPIAASEPEVSQDDEEAEETVSDVEEDEESSEDESLATALAATTLESSKWKEAPRYDALYLSTDSEYLPPAPKQSIPASAIQVEEVEDDKKSKDASWSMEGYENSLDIDNVFERFTKRVGYEAEQCLRYELGGMPLAFARDDIFDKLFPVPPVPLLPVTKPGFMVVPPAKRTFDPAAIPTCPHCQGKRVFECQLMPNLINVLKLPSGDEAPASKSLTDDERRKEVEAAMKGGASVERTGMTWGTCMVFSCERDCCEEKAKGTWREELVFIQWDR